MIATGAYRRARSQSEAAIEFAGRPLHHFWPLFAAYFRGVLLMPHGRTESELVTWEWQEPHGAEPPSRAELKTLRKRLATDRANFLDSVETIADDPGRRATVKVAELAQALNAVLTALLERDDAEFARCVARTSAGLRLHGWGLSAPAVVTYPDEHDAANGSAPPPASAEVSRPARRRRGVVVWVAIGLAVLGAVAAWLGRPSRPPDGAARPNVEQNRSSDPAGSGKRGRSTEVPQSPVRAPQVASAVASTPAVAGAASGVLAIPRETVCPDRDVAVDAVSGSGTLEVEEKVRIVPGSPAGMVAAVAATGRASGRPDAMPRGAANGTGSTGVRDGAANTAVTVSPAAGDGVGADDVSTAGPPVGANAAATVRVRAAGRARVVAERSDRDARDKEEEDSPAAPAEARRTIAPVEPPADLRENPTAESHSFARETTRGATGAEAAPLDRSELGQITRRLVRVDDAIAPTLPVRRGAKVGSDTDAWANALMRPPGMLAAADVALTVRFELPDHLRAADAEWQAAEKGAGRILDDGRIAELTWPLPADGGLEPIRATLVGRRGDESDPGRGLPVLLAFERDETGRWRVTLPPRTGLWLGIAVRFPAGVLSGEEAFGWEDASGAPASPAIRTIADPDGRIHRAEWRLADSATGVGWTLRLREARTGWAWVFAGGTAAP